MSCCRVFSYKPVIALLCFLLFSVAPAAAENPKIYQIRMINGDSMEARILSRTGAFLTVYDGNQTLQLPKKEIDMAKVITPQRFFPAYTDQLSNAEGFTFKGVEIQWGISQSDLVEIVNKPAAWWNLENRPGYCRSKRTITSDPDRELSKISLHKLPETKHKNYVTNYLADRYPFLNTPGITVLSDSNRLQNWIFWNNHLFALLDDEHKILYGTDKYLQQIRQQHETHIAQSTPGDYDTLFYDTLKEDLLAAGINYATYKQYDAIQLDNKLSPRPFAEVLIDFSLAGGKLEEFEKWWNFLVAAGADARSVGSFYFNFKTASLSYDQASHYAQTGFVANKNKPLMWLNLIANGISPREAMEWSQLGYVDVKSICGVAMGHSFTDNIEEAKNWLSIMSFDDAMRWHKDFTSNEAEAFRRYNIGYKLAKKMGAEHIDLDTFLQWREIEITDMRKIKEYRKMDMSPAEAGRWKKAGIKAHNWEKWRAENISPEEAQQWVYYGFKAYDARWISKEITLQDAKKLEKANVPKNKWQQWKRYVKKNNIKL